MPKHRLLLIWLLIACQHTPVSHVEPCQAPSASASDVDRRLSTWLTRWQRENLALDEPLLNEADTRLLQTRITPLLNGYDNPNDNLYQQAQARVGAMATDLRDGRYVTSRGEPLPLRAVEAATHLPPAMSEGRWIDTGTATWLRCTAISQPFYSARSDGGSVDTRFDRNHCSFLRAGEHVFVLGMDDDNWLVASANAVGFVDGRNMFNGAPPLDERPQEVLTRRRFFSLAFAHLGERYRWAGVGENPDCSGLMTSVFERFSLTLPRNSGDQIRAGMAVEHVANLDSNAKLEVFERLHRRGIVLLGFPGHVMLYLGRSDSHEPMVLHALSEFAWRCGTEERVERVDRVLISDLTLGRGSSRTSLLERITDATVFGQ